MEGAAQALVQLEKDFSFLFFLARRLFELESNSGSFCQLLHRLGKAEFVEFHEELDRRSRPFGSRSNNKALYRDRR